VHKNWTFIFDILDKNSKDTGLNTHLKLSICSKQ
jgi:hypothetical protein